MMGRVWGIDLGCGGITTRVGGAMDHVEGLLGDGLEEDSSVFERRWGDKMVAFSE